MSISLIRRAAAEAVGTFALVFVGCGAAMVDSRWPGSVGPVGVALAFGLVIAVMIYATGHVSGAHFNPAVTVAFASLGEIGWREVLAYVAAQVSAAIAASGLLWAVIGDHASLGSTVPIAGLGSSFATEVVLTSFLMFVITAVATDKRAHTNLAGLAIGGTVTLAALMGGPISGASMNPARSVGPALVSGELTALWLYLLAPALGALLGAWTYRLLSANHTTV